MNKENRPRPLYDKDIIELIKERFPDDSEKAIECKFRCFKALKNFHDETRLISRAYDFNTYAKNSEEISDAFFSVEAVQKGTYYTDVRRKRNTKDIDTD